MHVRIFIRAKEPQNVLAAIYTVYGAQSIQRFRFNVRGDITN